MFNINIYHNLGLYIITNRERDITIPVFETKVANI